MTDFYCKVENGEIKRINVSAKNARKGLINFPQNPTDDDYREHGFYPVVGSRPQAGEWERVAGPTRSVNEADRTVVQEYTVTQLSQAEIDAVMVDRAIQDFIAETDLLKTGYTQAEIDSFPTQEAEAVAYLADPVAPTPLLDAILAVTGENKADLVSHITSKAAALKVGLGEALGKKRKKVKTELA